VTKTFNLPRRFAFFACFAALLLFSFSAARGETADPQNSNDTVIVLPFENTSPQREFNWVGETFAEELSELLATSGLNAVSSDERELAYQKLRLPLTTMPSRATTIKIALESKATLVVFGTYEVSPARNKDEVPAIRGTARMIRIKEGRMVGEQMPDGRWATNQFDFGDAITNLRSVQAQLAYQILYLRYKEITPVSMREFIERAQKVPARAAEAYYKGKMTADKNVRSIFFQNALYEYAKANGGATYPQAAFELGMLYFEKNDWAHAAQYLSLLQKKDPHYVEAQFYAGLSYWKVNDLTRSLGALLPLAADTPRIDVYNNAGAIALQAAREAKKKEDRDPMLTQALQYLKRAADSAPEDPLVHFNYAYALLMNNQFREAATAIRPVITLNARDGEAQFILAKALERAGDKDAAASADNEARKYNSAYAALQTAWQKDQSPPQVPLRLYLLFSRDVPVPIDKGNAPPPDPTSTKDLLAKAREFYAAGNDEEALTELRRVLTIEPMSAEAYLLIGRINLRRGELDSAISALKTAIFWEPKMVDPHILLGRIFLERGDRTMAMSYARNALQIDPNNQEAIGLQRQVETGMR
jgi:tetratricopeptide (TPR) repeat protein/TolB-like protein